MRVLSPCMFGTYKPPLSKVQDVRVQKISFQPKEKEKCELADGSGHSQQGDRVSSRFDDVNGRNL